MRASLALTALTLIFGLSVAYAQEQKAAPEQKAPTGGMMMQDDAMKAQMSRMMENCNKMMESHMKRNQQGG
jgi:hypothetical protein